MLALQCTFCDHANPEDARFCNACGSCLQIKICPRCEAVNGQSMNTCYQCGGEFPAPVTTLEAAADATFEQLPLPLRGNARAFPAEETSAVSPIASEALFDQRLIRSTAPAHSSAAATRPIPIRLRPGLLPCAEATAESVAVEHREPTWRPSRSKSTMAAAIGSVAVVSAIAMSAYYVDYRAQVAEPLNAKPRNSTTTHDLATSATPTREAPVAKVEGPGPASQVGTPANTPYTPQSVPNANGAYATTVAAKPRPKAVRTATEPAVPTGSVPTPESAFIRSAPSRSGANVSPAAPSGIVCTQATAAAGLCSLGPSEHQAQTSSLPTGDQTAFASPSATHAMTVSSPSTAQSERSQDRSSIAPASPRPNVCTEAIAAAGLCSPSPTQESK